MKILSQILDAVGVSQANLAHITISGHDPVLATPFLIGEAGAAALAAVGHAASQLWFLKTQKQQDVSIDVKDAAIAQLSHNYFRVLDGENQDLWSPISGFYQTKDNRWIQFHCNFPHHKQGVLDLLKCADDKIAVAEAMKNWNALELETKLSELGMCAAMVRTKEEWEVSGQGKAVADLPLLEVIKIGKSVPEPLPSGAHPLSGIKTVELTRVIAGPVCGKMLAQLGSTVMRITSPHLPFILPLVMDNGFGKLSAHLDLVQKKDKETLFELTKQADIFLQAYRPGALAQRGFSPENLAKMRPGIICIDLSAYSHRGPWANRHGFDSLVQSATGIAHEQGQEGKPKHLPAQTLDYVTGFLAAFGAMVALHRRATEGGSYLVRVSLAQTAHWLKSLGRVKDYQQCQTPTREQMTELLTQSSTLFGQLEHLLPVLKLSETPLKDSSPSAPLGTHVAKWN
jgi:crotonobetainyl-CoA:carnitine CoA-transferase CaiB-like acyl-CoA transferase